MPRRVWEAGGGSEHAWQSPEPYVSTALPGPRAGRRVLHIVRDLSAWVPQRSAPWDPGARDLLQTFSATLFPPAGSQPSRHIFLIAGNDGQLMETCVASVAEPVRRSHDLFETLLVEDHNEQEGVSLRFFNLSRYESASFGQRPRRFRIA